MHDDSSTRVDRSRAQAAAYYAAHREDILAKRAARRAANLEEVRARSAAYMRTYRAENPEKALALDRAYKEAHRDELNARKRARRAERSAEQCDEDRARCRRYAATRGDELRKRARDRYRSNAAWLKELTASTPCADCGGTSAAWHHVEPGSKVTNLSTMCSWSRARLAAFIDSEMAKCVALCRSCHMRRHIELRKVK